MEDVGPFKLSRHRTEPLAGRSLGKQAIAQRHRLGWSTPGTSTVEKAEEKTIERRRQRRVTVQTIENAKSRGMEASVKEAVDDTKSIEKCA